MSETSPGTDRVELTDDERASLNCDCVKYDGSHYDTCFVPAVESLVAARVQALTAERDELRASKEWAVEKGIKFPAERDAARAELAAANDRIAELTELFDGLRDDYQKACEEVERLQHHGWEDENAALQATLDRVTAVINTPDGHREWHNQGRSGVCQVVDVSRLRAALTPEGKP